jgi:hypothetical protein
MKIKAAIKPPSHNRPSHANLCSIRSTELYSADVVDTEHKHGNL